MISGINHVTLAVHDLVKSFRFYRDVLGFKPLVKWPEGAYFLSGDLWFCLILDPKTRTGPLPEYTHLAFSVRKEDFTAVSEKIRMSGATIWKENSSPGESLYFSDPNGHKLEIHASNWKSRIETAKNEKWEGMEFFV
jgi:catechol 2,3-dioxygenase-like lactoylglutathione lyase family enzyme